MNALYVTVSIPLLLVLAGFNHAHGLTTFGKSTSQGNQNIPNPANAKPCNNQVNCALIKGTTCLRGFCLCGDNTNPVNGICNTPIKGPRHVCEKDEDCVDGADCLPREKNKPATNNTTDLICKCQEGLSEIGGTACGGGGKLSIMPVLVLIFIVYSTLKFK